MMDGTVIGAGSNKDRASVSLATIDGWRVPNERREERHPEALRAALRLWQHEKPGIIPRSMSSVYNCVGMAFANRRTWIDPYYIVIILKRDGYKRIENSEVQISDVVVYYKNSAAVHVGLVVGINQIGSSQSIRILSQWGADGEYFHKVQNVPESYGYPTYWSERRNL